MLCDDTPTFATAQRKWMGTWLAATLAMSCSLAVISLAACSTPTEERRDSFRVDSSPLVKVMVSNGDLDLVVGVAGEIEVAAELRT